ncbi:MAG: hypothetical protein GY797_20360 [Deltaproteobacteria bacterium]|nr:hypothetical protein [Deltaproteobacteria bacterium]
MWRVWFIFIITSIPLGCCFAGIPLGSYEASPPDVLRETDLVGMWQAQYGTSRIDKITLKADGTYQQIFEAPLDEYYFKSDWNKWYVEYSSSGKPKLHLEKMGYCVYFLDECESTRRGEPKLYYDFSENKSVKLTGKVILQITIDETNPRGIRLWHLQIDEDVGPAFFVSVDE